MADLFHVHIQTVYRYLNKHNIREPFKSSDEKEIERFLIDNNVKNIVKNSRKILPSGKELDFYLPDYNLAIEYNGVYWHHEDINHITRNYHNNKYKECERLGIQLITIFSNFWKFKKEIVQNILMQKIGLAKHSIYARDTLIKTVSTVDARDFLNKTHIQGYTPATYRYGLYNKDILVAIMTFGNRAGIGKRDNSIELIRFSSLGRVVGGASKLLKQFRKEVPDLNIISYSDNEWSDGNLYNVLGFTLEKELPPSYWYFTPRSEKWFHRYNFAKHKLIKLGYDKNKTEREITKEMGLLKLWDCGKRKWVLYTSNK